MFPLFLEREQNFKDRSRQAFLERLHLCKHVIFLCLLFLFFFFFYFLSLKFETCTVFNECSWTHYPASTFFFFLIYIYLFGCTESQLRHVGSSSLTRDRTWAPLHWEPRVLATGLPGKSPSLYILRPYFNKGRGNEKGKSLNGKVKMAVAEKNLIFFNVLPPLYEY